MWKTTPISQATWPLTAMALGMGGNVRVGLEDNFYLPSGEMVKSNGELVAHAVAMAQARRARARHRRRDARQISGAHAMTMMKDRVKELEERRAQIKQMGGEEKVAKQHERGKLTARERLAASSTTACASRSACTARRWRTSAQRQAAGRRGALRLGQVDGRMVCAAAYDFTVKGGSIGHDRRGQGHAPARDGAARPHADGVVHRLGGRAHRSASRADTPT